MNKEQKEDLTREEENVLYWAGWLALPCCLFTAYAIANWILPNIKPADCIFWTLFGAYCPGCGGTRSVLALLEGNILRSIWYHPLIMYGVSLYTIFMVTHTLEKLHVPFIKGLRFRVWFMYGALWIIGINFVLKNILKFGFGIAM